MVLAIKHDFEKEKVLASSAALLYAFMRDGWSIESGSCVAGPQSPH